LASLLDLELLESIGSQPSSPGQRQIFKLLSRSKCFKVLCPSNICFTYVPPEHEIDANFALIIVQIHFLLNKFYNISHFMLKLVTFEFSKTYLVPVPGRLRKAAI